jgi:hypothetical protein
MRFLINIIPMMTVFVKCASHRPGWRVFEVRPAPERRRGCGTEVALEDEDRARLCRDFGLL